MSIKEVMAELDLGKMTDLAHVEALTRTELVDALTNLGSDLKETQRKTRRQMVEELWKAIRTASMDIKPLPQPPQHPDEKELERIRKKTAREKLACPSDRPSPKKKKVPQLCTCGCKGKTKGGRYLPGHDAKHASALKGGSKSKPRPCACGCKTKTKGGKWRPGHDAKHYSRLLKEEREKLAKKAKASATAKAIATKEAA